MYAKNILISKIFFILGGIFLLSLVFTGFILYQISLFQAQSTLAQTVQRIRDDVRFAGGKWELSRYDADPNIQADGPVYILGSDGSVIDRWKPIHGFLDTSDIKHLLAYQTPQTITTTAQQQWRIYSQPILNKKQAIGVITVAIFNPSLESDTTDQRLLETADLLAGRLTIRDNSIQIGHIDIRDISYDISFQVVDQFNKIIAKNNNTNSIDRIPNFIDPSYIGNLLESPTQQTISDSVTKEKFLFMSSPIIANGNVVGVIAVGKSITSIYSLIKTFLFMYCFFLSLLLLGTTYGMYRAIRSHLSPLTAKKLLNEIKRIVFDKKTGVVTIDNSSVSIPIATNQFYVCEALFSNPKKHFESDEILDRFGEHEFGNVRKIYDAIITINKKLAPLIGAKLIVIQGKRYQLNPQLLHLIK